MEQGSEQLLIPPASEQAFGECGVGPGAVERLRRNDVRVGQDLGERGEGAIPHGARHVYVVAHVGTPVMLMPAVTQAMRQSVDGT